MLKSPLLKYVASPQTFAYMPPVLGGCAIGIGMFMWFFGQVAGFGVIPGLLFAIIGGAISAAIGFREPQISNMLLAKQKFMKKTPGFVAGKGKTYVA